MYNLTSKDGEFTFHFLETDEDVEQNLELMRIVFGQEDVQNLVKKLIDHHPEMTLNDFFIIKHHGKAVAGLNLIPLKWSIGGVQLKVAEMGCVATLPKYRHLGLQRRLVNEFHKRAAEQKYDLCAIEGIPYYYRQFGYEYALPLDEEAKIELNKIPHHEATVQIRPFIEEDIPKAMKLLARSQKKFYVHSIRDEHIWRMQQKTSLTSADRFEGYAVEKDADMIACFRTIIKPESKELILSEATDAEGCAVDTILSFLLDTGKQHGLATLSARTSYHDSITKQLVSLGAVQRIPPYAWQIRIVDYERIFQKMKPLFEERLAASSLSGLTEKLDFNFYRHAIQVTIENGIVEDVQKIDNNEDRTIRINPQVFVQLLLGHRSREGLEQIYPDVIVRSSHKHLIDVLFPKLPSHIHCTY